MLDEAQAAQEQLEADGVDETSITEFGQGADASRYALSFI